MAEGDEMTPTFSPPSLSRGSTWTVRPREEASQAGPSQARTRTRLNDRVLRGSLLSISALQH